MEIDGVLKSWTLPKKPECKNGQKRLAVQVSDHALEYRNFEGQIQKGFYAAGVVRIWDRGEFIPLLRKCNQKDSQLSFDIWQETLKELASGRFNFILKGKKLKGRFTLIKLKNQGSNWLFLFQSHQISIPVAKK